MSLQPIVWGTLFLALIFILSQIILLFGGLGFAPSPSQRTASYVPIVGQSPSASELVPVKGLALASLKQNILSTLSGTRMVPQVKPLSNILHGKVTSMFQGIRLVNPMAIGLERGTHKCAVI